MVSLVLQPAPWYNGSLWMVTDPTASILLPNGMSGSWPGWENGTQSHYGGAGTSQGCSAETRPSCGGRRSRMCLTVQRYRRSACLLAPEDLVRGQNSARTTLSFFVTHAELSLSPLTVATEMGHTVLSEVYPQPQLLTRCVGHPLSPMMM